MADRGTGSLRSRLAKLLARRFDTLIMLSSIPHDGKARSFASLVNMLDATAITNPDDYAKEDFRTESRAAAASSRRRRSLRSAVSGTREHSSLSGISEAINAKKRNQPSSPSLDLIA